MTDSRDRLARTARLARLARPAAARRSVVSALAAAAVTATLMAGVPAAPTASAAAPPLARAAEQAAERAAEQAAGPRTIRLDGVRVRVRPGVRQVVTVNRTRGHHARVLLWVRGDDGWERRLAAGDGRIGYNGLVLAHRRRQGSGTTPIGTFRLPWAFGHARSREVWALDYRRVRRGDYWVMDNASRHYNRYRNKRQGGFRWRLPVTAENGSERLTDYPVQYELSVVTSFNQRQVRHRGAGIFLHVNGSGATAGCVSAPRWFLVALLRRLDPERRPVIAIGR